MDDQAPDIVVLDRSTPRGPAWCATSVEYTLTVTDTHTGAVHTYPNPSGRLASVAATGAF